MPDSVWASQDAALIKDESAAPRHTLLIRLTHWVNALCFFALLLSGIEILISHPRFYWGETGNVMTPPLFSLHIPASRSSVPTGYKYVLPDQNGWSRNLHFQSAWLLVITGLLYGVSGIVTGHFRRNLFPARGDLSWRSLREAFASHLRMEKTDEASYNLLQRISYVKVVFLLVPLAIWTGLAMSPAVVSAFPLMVTVFGGQQSARTVHFFVTIALVLFVIVHIVMVCITGFQSRMRAMTLGGGSTTKGQL